MSNKDMPEPAERFHNLLDRGLSREKAERILNAEAGKGEIGLVGEPETYDDWTEDELFDRATVMGIEDRTGMSRAELIAAIREL